MVPSMSFFATGNVSFTSDHREGCNGSQLLKLGQSDIFSPSTLKPHDLIATNWEKQECPFLYILVDLVLLKKKRSVHSIFDLSVTF